MTRVRIGLLAAVVCLAASGAVVSNAVAAPGGQGSGSHSSVPPLDKVHVTGVTHNGGKFSGTYAIQRFVVARVNGKRGAYAVGTLTGTVHGHHVSRSNVLVPAGLSGAGSSSSDSRSVRATTCTVLNLLLGPITLNLLGLDVTIGGGTAGNLPILVNLTAVQGGGLLGDLLCGLDNALGGSSTLSGLTSQLGALTGALNALTSLLGAGAPTVAGA